MEQMVRRGSGLIGMVVADVVVDVGDMLGMLDRIGRLEVVVVEVGLLELGHLRSDGYM